MAGTVMTKTTRDGRTVEFQVRDIPGGYYEIRAYIGQNMVSSGTAIEALHQPVQGCTHRLGKVGLTTAEAEALQAIIEATPAYQMAQLCMARKILVIQARVLNEDAQVAYWYLHSQERVGAWGAKSRLEKEAEDARRELADFDAIHPEIIAQNRAEQAEATERFARID